MWVMQSFSRDIASSTAQLCLRMLLAHVLAQYFSPGNLYVAEQSWYTFSQVADLECANRQDGSMITIYSCHQLFISHANDR